MGSVEYCKGALKGIDILIVDTDRESQAFQQIVHKINEAAVLA